MMDEATIDLWLSQAQQDDVISPGFRPEVQRRMLEQQAEIARLREERNEAREKWGAFLNFVRDNVYAKNWLCDQRTRSFQMMGLYDGAMSEECKRLCEQEYQLICSWLKEVTDE